MYFQIRLNHRFKICKIKINKYYLIGAYVVSNQVVVCSSILLTSVPVFFEGIIESQQDPALLFGDKETLELVGSIAKNHRCFL